MLKINYIPEISACMCWVRGRECVQKGEIMVGSLESVCLSQASRHALACNYFLVNQRPTDLVWLHLAERHLNIVDCLLG